METVNEHVRGGAHESCDMTGVGCVQVRLKGKACAAREGLDGVKGVEGLA